MALKIMLVPLRLAASRIGGTLARGMATTPRDSRNGGTDASPTELLDGKSLTNAQTAKLQRSLETPSKRLLTNAERGVMDAQSEDVLEVLNEALSSSQLYNLFQKTGDASKFVEFSLVRLNQDRSHTTVLWSSSVLEKFAAKVRGTAGEQEAARFAKRAVENVNSRLQRREPLFRSLLIKKMDFKRVPRLFFRPLDASLTAAEGSGANAVDQRQVVMQEFAARKR
jgi:ribosome-binding factor A